MKEIQKILMMTERTTVIQGSTRKRDRESRTSKTKKRLYAITEGNDCSTKIHNPSP